LYARFQLHQGRKTTTFNSCITECHEALKLIIAISNSGRREKTQKEITAFEFLRPFCIIGFHVE
jgi:hypothetical protein